jgi:hypothetical protein
VFVQKDSVGLTTRDKPLELLGKALNEIDVLDFGLNEGQGELKILR